MDPTNRNTALCSVLVDELARSGVEHACVAPGSRSAPLALAFWNDPRVKTWSLIDERCAGFFALGLAQQTGKPVVVVTTSGTAGANVHPAVAEAGESCIPLIVITTDRPPEMRDRGAGQTIDQIKLYGDSARWFCELGNIDAGDEGLLLFRSTGCRATAEATGPHPGPVHLNVPLREPLAPTAQAGQVTATRSLALKGRSDGRPLTSVTPKPEHPLESVVSALHDLIGRSPKGLIVAGRQHDSDLPPALADLSAATGYPILAEPTSRARAGGHDRTNVVAAYDAIFRELPNALMPELIIRFGELPTSKTLRQWIGGQDDCAQIVSNANAGWNEPTSVAAALVGGDPVSLCTELASARPNHDRAWSRDWLVAEQVAQKAIDDYLNALGAELCEPGVHHFLADLLTDGSLVYVASSMPIRDLEAFLPSCAAKATFLANRGANGIDGLVSSGLGAAAAGRPSTVITGDVGLYHDMNGLLAMKRNGVEATIVVLNNGGGSIFDFLPIAGHSDGYEELFATPTGLDLERVASLYELAFTRIGSYDELAQVWGKPGMIEVPTDRARNLEIHRELSERVRSAIA